MTVRQLLRSLDSYELAQWQQYERLFGTLGPRRDDILAADIAMTVYNSQVPKKSQAKPHEKFLRDWTPVVEVDEEDELGDDT
jgi:hypothetical protein